MKILSLEEIEAIEAREHHRLIIALETAAWALNASCSCDRWPYPTQGIRDACKALEAIEKGMG